MIAVDRLPPEIRASVRAVVWRSVAVPGREKPTKVPYIPSRPAVKANVSDPRTWGTFVAALAAVQAGKADGPGIVLGDGLVGVDLDECRDPCTGTIAPEALAIIQTLDSYTELSPSRTGLHILARGTLPPGGRRKAGVEMYAEGRFFTVTGMHVVGTPTTIEERTAELLERAGIMARTGLHCAPSAHERLGTFPTGTVRFSFGWFNTRAEVDLAVEALAQIAAWVTSGEIWTA